MSKKNEYQSPGVDVIQLSSDYPMLNAVSTGLEWEEIEVGDFEL